MIGRCTLKDMPVISFLKVQEPDFSNFDEYINDLIDFGAKEVSITFDQYTSYSIYINETININVGEYLVKKEDGTICSYDSEEFFELYNIVDDKKPTKEIENIDEIEKIVVRF
jgi:hypothetical protein